MSFSLLTSATVGGVSGGTTSGIDTTGANFLVIHAGYSTSATISDSAGNTWTAGTASSAGGMTTRFYWCISPTGVGPGHTFTIAGSVGAIVVSAWAVTGTVALDSQSTATTAAASSFTNIGAATFTPTVDNCLVIGGSSFSDPAGASYGAASGWTLVAVKHYTASTNYGAGQAYKVQTTATAIPTSESVTKWSGSVTRLSIGIAFRETAGPAAITISTPTTRKAYQRNGSSQANIAISGTYAGTPTSIEASFNGGAYQTIVASPTGGTYSGTLTAQAAGSGTLTVRHTNDTAISATVANLLIGDVFAVGGDSISEGRGTNAQSYTHATLISSVFRQNDAWANANDPFDTGTNIGVHWPLLATQIMAGTGVPVAFISAGTGSTDVAGSQNQWAKNNSGYAEMISQVTASGVSSIKGVLMHLGPNAVVNASTLSKATYNAAIDTLAANYAADIAGAPKMLVGICGEVATGSPPDRRAALDNIRGAIVEAWGDNANVLPGPCLIEQDYSDGVHPVSDAELAVVAKRWWLAVQQAFYSGTNGRGPRLSGANWNAGRDQITVVFDRALKTGLTFGTGAWKVVDNVTAMTISSIAYHGSDPNALVISTSAAAVGAAGTTRLTFASGEDAKGLVVPMSTDISMPVGGAIQIPAEPIYAAAVNEVDVTAPTLSAPSFSGTGQTTGAASVSTNEGNGTLYCVVTLSATPPTAAQIRAGQNQLGNAAPWSGSQVVSSTGTKSFSATGLTASTTYFAHFTHRDASGNDSAVASSAGDATDSPVIMGGGIYVKVAGAYVLVATA